MGSDDLVRKITAEVMKRLGNPVESAQATTTGDSGWMPVVSPKDKRVLVLLTGGNRRLDEALVQVGKVAACSQETCVVLSASAQKTIGVPAVRRAAPEAKVVTDGDV